MLALVHKEYGDSVPDVLPVLLSPLDSPVALRRVARARKDVVEQQPVILSRRDGAVVIDGRKSLETLS